MKAEAGQLSAKLAAAQDEVEKFRTSQARLTAELAARTQELEAARVATRAPLQERDALRSQMSDMFTKLSDAERRLGQLTQAAGEAEKTRGDLAARQEKYRGVEKAAEQHGASVAELTGVNEKITNEKAALDQQLAQSRQSLELARAETTGLRAENAKLGAADRQHEARAE